MARDSASVSGASRYPRGPVFINLADTRWPIARNQNLHELDARLRYCDVRVLPFIRQAHKPDQIAYLEFLRVRHIASNVTNEALRAGRRAAQ